MSTEKSAGSVVTSENAANFYAERLGLAESKAEPEAAETEKVEAEPVAEEQSEPPEAETAKPQEERKQNPKIEKRFSEITRQREEARAEAQREREARASLEARLAELERQSAPKTEVKVDQEPQPHQFEDAFEYAKALADYRVEQRFNQEKQAQEQARVQAERAKIQESWLQKVVAAKSEMPDFDEMIASAGDTPIPDHIRDAVMDSDVGPKILYHFANNPELVGELSNMNPAKALREIGKLETRFESKDEKPPVVARSKAPEPIQPIRGAGKADVPMTSDGVFKGSYHEWKAMRKAGKIR
jgi:hypothetical protein